MEKLFCKLLMKIKIERQNSRCYLENSDSDKTVDDRRIVRNNAF